MVSADVDADKVQPILGDMAKASTGFDHWEGEARLGIAVG
jgi:hypothetical protein